MISLYDIHLQYMLKSLIYFFCGLPLRQTAVSRADGMTWDLAKVSWSSARDLLACQWKSESICGFDTSKQNSSLSCFTGRLQIQTISNHI